MDGQEVTASRIERAASGLRSGRRALLRKCDSGRLRERAVDALSLLAERWRDRNDPIRRQAERENAGFPFAMVWVSLEALLDSLSRPALERLIVSEAVAEGAGPELIGHVIASNTPLLAWTSLCRALLVGSASLVKLPSHPVGAWARYFQASLAQIDPDLAGLIALIDWKGGETPLDSAFCRACDLVLAYGADETMRSLAAAAAPDRAPIAYGHRISFGLAADSADLDQAACGLARDILLYDQGGCLSPHTVFVEGGYEDAAAFASRLADSLAERCLEPECRLPGIETDFARAAVVRQVREIASMEADCRIWQGSALRWTVIAKSEASLFLSPTHGIVYVAPLWGKDITDVLAGIDCLQGAALAASGEQNFRQIALSLARLGISYVCAPGELQRPPLGWRQNGMSVLGSLLARKPLDRV